MLRVGGSERWTHHAPIKGTKNKEKSLKNHCGRPQGEKLMLRVVGCGVRTNIKRA